MKAELEWTKRMLSTIHAFSNPSKCAAIQSVPLKHLLAKLNVKHQFQYYFGNALIAKDLRTYAEEALEKAPEPSRSTITVSEAIKRGAKKTSDAIENLGMTRL